MDEHLKHLKTFFNVIKGKGLAVSAPKMKLFQNKIKFLAHDMFNGTIKPIQWSIKFADNFLDKIDKNELQRFFGCVNYVADFPPNLGNSQTMKKNPFAWSHEHNQIVEHIKSKIKWLPCRGILKAHAFMIVQTDVSDKGFERILKQRLDPNPEQLVRCHIGTWTWPPVHYSTIKE